MDRVYLPAGLGAEGWPKGPYPVPGLCAGDSAGVSPCPPQGDVQPLPPLEGRQGPDECPVQGELWSVRASFSPCCVTHTPYLVHPACGCSVRCRNHRIDGDAALCMQVAFLKARPPITADESRCPDSLRAALIRCYDEDPARRPTSTELLGILRQVQNDLDRQG